jgi:3-methyladenine DNA glycosylase Mpg
VVRKLPDGTILKGRIIETEAYLKLKDHAPAAKRFIDGPGRLAKAKHVELEQNGRAFFTKKSRPWIEDDQFRVRKSKILKTARIGLKSKSLHAKDWGLRFVLKA